MRGIVYLFIGFIAFGCTNRAHKTENVQACLDTLYNHQRQAFTFWEKTKLILLKDKYTSDLGKLHYGANNIVIQEVSDRATKDYLEGKDTTRRYIKIKYLIIDPSHESMELSNWNQTIKFDLQKDGSAWKAKITEMTIR